MTDQIPQNIGAEPLPEVQLEVRQGGRSTPLSLSHVDFLVGSVPGCDLRVPGADLPAVLCLFARRPGGLTLRKLAPTQILLVNGQTVSNADLREGDRVTLGAIDLFVRKLSASQEASTTSAVPPRPPAAEVVRFQAERDAHVRDQADSHVALSKREKELADRTEELEKERLYWYQRREELQKEVAASEKVLANRIPAGELDQRERDVVAKEKRLAERETELDRQTGEIAQVRQELADIRKELYQRYQERRDRLAGLQEAIDRAAKKVQDRKREVDAEASQVKQQRLDAASHQVEMEKRSNELMQRLADFERSKQDIDRNVELKTREIETRRIEIETREAKCAAMQRQYEADLIRIDRRQAQLDQREQELADRTTRAEQRFEELQKAGADLEEQIRQIDEVRVKLADDTEKLAKKKAEQEALEVDLIQRAAALEGQQATFATLRTKLDRQKDDLRRQEMQLEEQRVRQDQAKVDLERREIACQELRANLDADGRARSMERQQLLDHQATLDAALAQLAGSRDRVAQDEQKLANDRAQFAEREKKLANHEALVQSQLRQLVETQERLDAERQALRERTQALAQAEETRSKLQDQLRRRGDELAAKQKILSEQTQRLDAETGQLQTRREEIEHLLAQIDERKIRDQRDFDEQVSLLEKQRADLLAREEEQRRQQEQLKELGREIADQGRNLAEERKSWEQAQVEAQAAHERHRSELETWRRDVQALAHQLPEVELKAGASLEKLSHAREQLRDHLAEVHAYVRQCQEHLEAFRQSIQDDADQIRQNELDLRTNQDEHRLALVAFRQQLIAWQGQVGEMKRLLARDESILQHKQAQIEEQAREVDRTTQDLAEKAQELREQHAAVEERRGEIDRHLAEMRAWYRTKLRDLAGLDLDTMPPASESSPAAASGDDETLIPTGRHILSLTDPVDPSDLALGERLQKLELVDEKTLEALLAESRRQRRSLRQVLLAGGVLSLYQLALIETGHVDALVLGPVRLVDRLPSSTHETLYRVFDPRVGRERLLRHLAEEEMKDAVRPDEYRQRFAQTQLTEEHLAGAVEVFDIAGRPAVLEEWLTGLPASDWPPLASVPGVCFRLLTQAALGLAAAHQHGLVHGHLNENLLILTTGGVLKIVGLGEPWWLAGQDSPAESPRADLMALGRVAAAWCSSTGVRRGAKAKPLPEALTELIDRMSAGSYGDTQTLLEDLDRIGADIPANAEAWDRLLRHVREHAAPEIDSRKTA